jgi:hypothetical protein
MGSPTKVKTGEAEVAREKIAGEWRYRTGQAAGSRPACCAQETRTVRRHFGACCTLMLAAGGKSAKAQSCSPCESSRQFKTPEGGVDAATLLSHARRMPLEVGAIQAGDFHTAFGLGDGKSIHPLDGIGVCFAAIQALNARIGSLGAAIN